MRGMVDQALSWRNPPHSLAQTSAPRLLGRGPNPRPHCGRIRAAAFAWLRDQVDRHGDTLPRRLLADGFTVGDQRVPRLGTQGIWKPPLLEALLSIATVDHMGPEGLRYSYRGTDPNHAAPAVAGVVRR